MPTPIRPNDGDGDSLRDRIVDPNEVDRAERHTRSWRAGFFTVAALFVVAMAANAMLAATMRTRAIVYFADPTEIKYIGETNQTYTPTLLQIKTSLRDYVHAMRHIPAGDPTLVDRDAYLLEAMMPRNSQAFEKWSATVQIPQHNPKIYAQKGDSRTAIDVSVSQIDALSYEATWQDHVRLHGQAAVNYPGTMTITLAGPPKPPNNPEIGKYNPVGIVIANYDLTTTPIDAMVSP